MRKGAHDFDFGFQPRLREEGKEKREREKGRLSIMRASNFTTVGKIRFDGKLVLYSVSRK